VRDSIELERAGIPSVAIVHKVLSPGATAMATTSGVPDYEWLTVDYPLEPDGLWSDEQVAQAARDLAPAVLRMLVSNERVSSEADSPSVDAMSTAPFDAALAPMSDMLAADGYRLALSTPDDGRLRVEVVAGPDACEECLVPQDIFKAIAQKYLSEKGLTPELELVYPEPTGEH
jgi:hypothetical protein